MGSGLLLLGAAFTPIHPGAGRSPGFVDLPVQRDSLGYPLVYASSVKGALKHRCFRAKCGGLKNKVNDEGLVRCSETSCRLCCCLFGPEPGEAEKGAGAIVVADLVPWALPVPSATHGYVYVSSPVLLSRLYSLLELTGLEKNAEAISKLVKEAEEKGIVALKDSSLAGQSLDIAGSSVAVQDSSVSRDELRLLQEILGKLGPLANSALERLVVADSGTARVLIDRGLLRVTRVTLRRDRKTVRRGALWTEEYLPIGTLFATAVIDTGYRNEYCDEEGIGEETDAAERLRSTLFGQSDRLRVFIGGKETVGRGLIVFRVYRG